MPLTKTKADLYTAPVLFALGAAVTVGGWRMDRLEIRGIHPASIPGLTPMILGVALMLCAALLYVEARRTARAAAPERGEEKVGSLPALLLAGGLCLIYALLLVGTLSFFIATALFIAAFAILFQWEGGAPRARNLRMAAFAALYGLAISAAVSALFRYGFLVRLP